MIDLADVAVVQLSVQYHQFRLYVIVLPISIQFLPLAVYQALHVNPHVVADVPLVVHVLLAIAVHERQAVEVFHSDVYFHTSHAVHVLADELYEYHPSHTKLQFLAVDPLLVHVLLAIAVHAVWLHDELA
jgi:hypothetical protein